MTPLFSHPNKEFISKEIMTLGAGCFWHVQHVLNQQDGILNTQVGYQGGTIANPSYEQVCSGNTHHAEVVYVEFDPQILSCEGLLEIFFQLHDPTTRNRQGPDIGEQYRSIIFCQTEEQYQTAQQLIQRLNASGYFKAPIVTELAYWVNFYPAEEYHQCYLSKK